MAAVLKKEIAIFLKEILPEELGLVTLTYVEVQPDFKNAKIYLSCLEESKKKQVLKKTEAKTKEIQSRLGHRLKMRYTPKVTFVLDESTENVGKIEELFEEIKAKGGQK